MKPTLTPLGAHPIGPGGFVLVIDQRRQHQRDVALHLVAARPLHLVAGARQNRRDVGHVDARHVVEFLLQIRHHRRHARERIETRSVAADDGILAHEPAMGFQICENDSHQSPQIRQTALRPENKQRQAESGGPRGDRGEKARLRGWRSREPMISSGRSDGDEAVAGVGAARPARRSEWPRRRRRGSACVPRRIRAVRSCRPASAWLDGRLSGPPNDFGCRGSFRATGVCGSQIGPDVPRRGAASAGSTDNSDSSAMPPAMVNARRGDDVNRM